MKWSLSKKILEEIDLLLLLMIRYKMVCVKKSILRNGWVLLPLT